MVVVSRLLNSDRNIKIGNHRLEIQDDKRLYYYFNTAIIVTTPDTITIDNGGWNTVSTKKAITCYIRGLINSGKNIIDKRGNC